MHTKKFVKFIISSYEIFDLPYFLNLDQVSRQNLDFPPELFVVSKNNKFNTKDKFHSHNIAYLPFF